MTSCRIAFVFLVAGILMAGQAGASIFPVGGSIDAVDVNQNTITVGAMTYQVTPASIVIVNGERAGIKDIAVGMRVSGAWESTSMSAGQRTMRLMNARTNPNYVAPPPAAAQPDATQPAVTQELTKKLAGTFWNMKASNPAPASTSTPAASGFMPTPATRPMPGTRTGPGGSTPGDRTEFLEKRRRMMEGRRWFYLHGDGTAKCGWTDEPGRWTVIDSVTIHLWLAGSSDFSVLRFDAGLTSGHMESTADSMGATHSTEVTLAGQPTQEMLARVPQGGAAGAAQKAPVSAESQQLAAGIVKTNHGNLVFVTGSAGAGSGFIATMNGAACLVTNAHVAAGISNANFKTLEGTPVKGTDAAVASGHDIFRMALPNSGGKPLEIMQGVDANAAIGDDVVVLGNAEGSGVINTLVGKIVGIGPQLVEIDAEFVPGNSGSPIIHLKSGKVIGVATYTMTKKYDTTTGRRMAEPVIRRFGYRLDSVKTWQPVNWQGFYAEAAALERIDALTKDLDAFFDDISRNRGKVTAARHTNPVIKTRITQWVDSKSRRMSDIDRQNADANFISFLKVACQADIRAAQGRLAYDYFQRRLAKEAETRDAMAKAFESIVRGIRD